MVFVNAELHTLSTEATPDFKYKSGSNASQVPYCRCTLPACSILVWFGTVNLLVHCHVHMMSCVVKLY